jgi:hypothetical protein
MNNLGLAVIGNPSLRTSRAETRQRRGWARILNEETAAIETVLRRTWDTAGSALLGAGLAALVQGSHELQQNIIAPSGVSEPIASSLLALVLAAFVGIVLFTTITVAHNVVVMRRGGEKASVELAYQRSDFAGALLGVLLVLAHEAFSILSGRWQTDFLGSADPFTHIVWELIIVALGGELWFRAVAKIRSWDAA